MTSDFPLLYFRQPTGSAKDSARIRLIILMRFVPGTPDPDLPWIVFHSADASLQIALKTETEFLDFSRSGRLIF